MKLVVLGSGTCLGPRVGQEPRLPPLFALDTAGDGAGAGKGRWIVFECSEGARFRLPAAGIDPAGIAHVAVSHPHPDHAALPQFVQGRVCEAILRPGEAGDLALTLYLPPLAAATLDALWRWHQPEDGGSGPSRFRLAVVATPDGFAREVFPGVVLRAYSVVHARGLSPAVAFRVETSGGVFAYSGDTGPCEGVVRAAAGASLFVCEAAARVGQDLSGTAGHLNPRQAGAVAREAGAARLLLTHYSGADPEAAMLADARASGYAGDVALARDGMVVAVAPRVHSPPW